MAHAPHRPARNGKAVEGEQSRERERERETQGTDVEDEKRREGLEGKEESGAVGIVIGEH